ncbi:MAG TPA: thioesterase family protein [Clostridia bacterium]|nr:thioesterase family protein [Clostridia bacterium]
MSSAAAPVARKNGQKGGMLTAHRGPAATVGEARLRVRYAETDQMGVVYHSNYIVWFEVGRVELLRQIGYTYREMEADGVQLPVAEVRCRYKSPARYDDQILIRTSIQNVRGALIQFGYEVLRQTDNTLLAEGTTTHLVVGGDMQRITLPEKYMTPFTGAMGR